MDKLIRGKLIPCLSTHFKLIHIGGYHSRDLTLGKIYKIEKWAWGDTIIFKDDAGDLRHWTAYLSQEDASYEYNLEKILE